MPHPCPTHSTPRGKTLERQSVSLHPKKRDEGFEKSKHSLSLSLLLFFTSWGSRSKFLTGAGLLISKKAPACLTKCDFCYYTEPTAHSTLCRKCGVRPQGGLAQPASGAFSARHVPCSHATHKPRPACHGPGGAKLRVACSRYESPLVQASPWASRGAVQVIMPPCELGGGGSPAPAGETGRLDEAAACSPGHGFLDPSISALLNPFSFVSVPSHGLNHPMGLVQIRFSYEDRKLRIAEAQTRRKFISVSRE